MYRLLGTTFPWGTLAVNILGSAFIGFFAALTAPEGRWLVGTTARQFVTIGLCGGFTTFSSFSLETLNFARDGPFVRAPTQWPRLYPVSWPCGPATPSRPR